MLTANYAVQLHVPPHAQPTKPLQAQRPTCRCALVLVQAIALLAAVALLAVRLAGSLLAQGLAAREVDVQAKQSLTLGAFRRGIRTAAVQSAMRSAGWRRGTQHMQRLPPCSPGAGRWGRRAGHSRHSQHRKGSRHRGWPCRGTAEVRGKAEGAVFSALCRMAVAARAARLACTRMEASVFCRQAVQPFLTTGYFHPPTWGMAP